MEKILISSCLLGAKVRYHGGDAHCNHPLIERWLEEKRLVSLCPEVSAGASIPRAPSEIIGSKIKNNEGADVSALYLHGAQLALEIVKTHHIKIAILKENSPSCGSHFIYDGTFTSNKIAGMGVTASLLTQHGIKIFSEEQLEEVEIYLNKIERNKI